MTYHLLSLKFISDVVVIDANLILNPRREMEGKQRFCSTMLHATSRFERSTRRLSTASATLGLSRFVADMYWIFHAVIVCRSFLLD